MIIDRSSDKYLNNKMSKRKTQEFPFIASGNKLIKYSSCQRLKTEKLKNEVSIDEKLIMFIII